ncbi:MAG: NAD(P)-dependent oxidoreductase [Nitrospirae bacterium]|nr:NAD(P)-dependent oxidoreductase [Nitrospirota bacterium]
MKILITGGSGFIGTNAVDFYLSKGIERLSIDIKEPQNIAHNKVFKRINILDKEALVKIFKDYSPTHVLHLAARTDLHEKNNIEGYAANIKGVENIVRAISNSPSVKRSIFASTKLVCPTDYTPKSDDDYCPNTLYGKSKVLGEEIVKSSSLQCDWCIVRPTSIWGPWSMMPHIPYGKFFQMIARGRYFHPSKENPPKSFGYVGNTVYQIMKLLDAPSDQIHKQIFYLSDYDVFTIKDWANMISMKLRGRQVRTIPEPIVRLLAWSGDLLKLFGIKEPPFSSFRLRNMRADTSRVPLENIKLITGPLPYTIEQGVDETITWLKKYNYI